MAKREVNMSSKRYPSELNMSAVRQVMDRGHSVAEVVGSNHRQPVRLDQEVSTKSGATQHSLYTPSAKACLAEFL